MPSDVDIQIEFLKWVKSRYANSSSTSSFTDELGELLAISRDSAYRRLRGETLLSFHEISRIAKHFGVSVDAFLNLSNHGVHFEKTKFTQDISFKSYMKHNLESLKLVNTCESKEMVWQAKDVPILHYFQFPALTAFKFFFWRRTLVDIKEMPAYNPDFRDEETLHIARESWNEYTKIPSTEIWSEETINITIRQIDFYHHCGIISTDHALELLEEFRQAVELIKKQATLGKKLTINGSDFLERETFSIYYNEIAISDNTIYFLLNDKSRIFITYNVLSILKTSDAAFCEEIRHFINLMLQKSIPLSATSEKERVRFFRQMLDKIEALRIKLEK